MSNFYLHGGSGFAQKDLAADIDEVWITVSVTFDPAIGTLNEFAIPQDSGGTSLFGIHYQPGTGWEELDNTLSTNASPAAQALGTFQTLEMHYHKSVATEAWVDGNLLWSAGETIHNQVHDILVGGAGAWTDWAKIGTTRGASDIFFDDFSSGDLSAWDSNFGTISVVSAVVADVPANVSVSVAFNDGPLEAIPSFTDLVGYDPDLHVRSVQIDRGRASEFEKTSTGTAAADITDEAGILDPTNSGSTFAGLINPMKQMQVTLTHPLTGVVHSLFRGFTDWEFDVDISEKFIDVTLNGADAFDLISTLEMTPGHHGHTPPAESITDIYFQEGPPGTIGGQGPSRIHKVLDDVGWPAGPREVFPGNVLLQPTIYERRDQALTAIFDAADAEFPSVANVYISKSGYVTFHGRYPRFDPTNPDYGIETWEVGDHSFADSDATIALISDLKFRRSKDDLRNAAQAIPQLQGGGNWTDTELSSMLVKDNTSIAAYGWRSESFDSLLTQAGRESATATTFPVSAVDECKKFSDWIVNNYKDPRTRVSQIEIISRDPSSHNGEAVWDVLCGVELGDRFHLQTSHPGGGGFSEYFFVDGIHYEIEPFHDDAPHVTLTVDVTPAALYSFNPWA